jgi:Mg-chelatase subunit ChlD
MTTALVPGSLQAIAQQSNQSIAESFLSADAIVLVDTSGSMSARDVVSSTWEQSTSLSRYEVACNELRKLQASLPGQIAVIAFSGKPEFAPSGTPRMIGGGTDLTKALAFVRAADGCEMRFIVISDGQPDDEAAALAEAARFVSRIDTVFVGPNGDPGAQFLKRLAAASGGQYSKNEVHQIAERVERLLLAGA